MKKWINGGLALMFLASNVAVFDVSNVGLESVKQLTLQTKVTANATIDQQFMAGTVMLKKAGITPAITVSESPVLTSRGGFTQLQPATPPKEEVRYYNIPLSRELQHYIWEQTSKYGLPYETVLAVIQTESTFNPQADNGIAGGLMQINYSDGTLYRLAKECGISNLDVHDPYQNVQMGIYYMHYLYQYWADHGVTEHTVSAMLISYNRGLGNAIPYIRNNGFSDSYTTTVFEHEDALKQ